MATTTAVCAEDLSALKYPSTAAWVNPAPTGEISEEAHSGIMGEALAGTAFIGMIAGLKLGARYAWKKMELSLNDKAETTPVKGPGTAMEAASTGLSIKLLEVSRSYADLIEPLILVDTRG